MSKQVFSYRIPELFLNNQKYIFEGDSKINILNQGDFEVEPNSNWNIELEQPDEQEIKIITKDLEELLNVVFPEQKVKQYALANYATCFMPYCPEKVIINLVKDHNATNLIKEITFGILGSKAELFDFTTRRDKCANFKGKTVMFDEIDTQRKKLFNDFKTKTDHTLTASESIDTGSFSKWYKYKKQNETFSNSTTLMINCNGFLPTTNDTSYSFSRRINVIPFYSTEKLNKNMIDTIGKLISNQKTQYVFIDLCIKAFVEMYQASEPNLFAEIIKPQSIKNIEKQMIIQ